MVEKLVMVEIRGVDHYSGCAADAPDAVLFKLATFIHMYFCILHLSQLRLVLLSYKSLVRPMEIDCISR